MACKARGFFGRPLWQLKLMKSLYLSLFMYSLRFRGKVTGKLMSCPCLSGLQGDRDRQWFSAKAYGPRVVSEILCVLVLTVDMKLI